MQISYYAGVIMAGGKGTELYPLTPKSLKALLPIGNKKMIYYQIEALEKAGITKTYILLNDDTSSVQQALQAYEGPMNLVFVSTHEDSQTYTALNRFLNQVDVQERLVIMSCDVVTNISIKELIQFHEDKKSAVTFALKEDKPKNKDKDKDKDKAKGKGKDKDKDNNEEKEEVDDSKLFLIDDNGRVIYAESMEYAKDLGIKVSNAVMRGVSNAQFRKVSDSHIYIIDQTVIKLIREFVEEGVSNWCNEFIPFMLSNQSNSNLLKYSSTPSTPLLCYARVYTTQLCQRIVYIEDYYEINMKSLIKGDKRIPILAPTPNTDKLVENAYEMSLLSDPVDVKENSKIKRSSVMSGVRIGRNVDVVNCVILKNTVIEDNCKLYNCIVGSKVYIRKGCTLRDCQVSPDCVIAENTTISDDVILNQE